MCIDESLPSFGLLWVSKPAVWTLRLIKACLEALLFHSELEITPEACTHVKEQKYSLIHIPITYRSCLISDLC